MSTLIRAGKMHKEPLVLDAHRAQSGAEHVSASRYPDANQSASALNEKNDRDAMAAEPPSAGGDVAEERYFQAPAAQDSSTLIAESMGAGVAAAALTYAEYKDRFQHELESLRAQAMEEGHREGEARARERIEAEYAQKLESLTQLIASVRQSLDHGFDSLHEIGAEIVYEAVLKIVGATLAERDGVRAVVREVIKRAKDATRLVIRVSPADFEILDNERASLLDGTSPGTVEIVSDERVEMGGCLLETPSGNLDGRLEVQLQCLRETLASVRARRTESGG